MKFLRVSLPLKLRNTSYVSLPDGVEEEAGGGGGGTTSVLALVVSEEVTGVAGLCLRQRFKAKRQQQIQIVEKKNKRYNPKEMKLERNKAEKKTRGKMEDKRMSRTGKAIITC